MLRIIIFLGFILLGQVCFSQETGVFIDKRDHQSYKTIQIGTQTWMAQNLNFSGEGSWCYDDSAFNCDKYGRLYTWEAALKSCPDHWHLPSNEEWTSLELFLGMTPEEVKIWLMRGDGEGTMLKNETEWEMENGEKLGYNSSGFNALPAGFLNVHNGKYTDLGKRASWWSSTPSDQYAIRRTLFYNKTGIDKDPATRTLGFSVRCIQNITE